MLGFMAAVAAILPTPIPAAQNAAGPAVRAAGQHQDAREGLGRAQADMWVPVDMLTAKTAASRRTLMLERTRAEIARRGSTIDTAAGERVLAAMAGLDRERFLPRPQRRAAYLPGSLDIGEGQTLSDAYLVTVMATAARVRTGDRVLDVGTGSGYQAALLDRLGGAVTTIEILPGLAAQASRRLKRLGFGRVRVIVGDGGQGAAAAAPFDAILAAAGSQTLPTQLVAQLAPGGRLVIPVGPTQRDEQLLVVTKHPGGMLAICTLGLAAAVPLTGPASAAGLPVPPGPLLPCYGKPLT